MIDAQASSQMKLLPEGSILQTLEQGLGGKFAGNETIAYVTVSRWRRDGFCALESHSDTGSVLLRGLLPRGVIHTIPLGVGQDVPATEAPDPPPFEPSAERKHHGKMASDG